MSLQSHIPSAADARAGGLRRGLDGLLTVGFCAALLAPLVDQIARPAIERGPERTELRKPAPFPVWPATTAGFAEFTRGLESHYADTMGFRDVLLRWRSLVQWCGLGVATSATVEQAPNGWAFYSGDGTRDVYRGVMPVRDEEMDLWLDVLEQRRDVCERSGAKYLYVLCPSKEVIYPELAPPTWNPVGPSRYEQFARRLAREPSFPFLDLRPAFLAAKAEDRPHDQLYNEFGTHWNGRGIYVAYRAIVERLRVDFPELELKEFSELIRLESGGDGDSFGPQLYIADRLKSATYGLAMTSPPFDVLDNSLQGPESRIIATGPANRTSLVWFHDSFGPYLHPLLFATFSYTSARQGLQFRSMDVFQEKPSVVLETFVDRSLYVLPPTHAVERAGMPIDASMFAGAIGVWSLEDREHPPTAFGAAEITRTATGLDARRVGPRDGLLLPNLELPAGSTPIVEITVVAPVPVSFDVFVRVVGATDFRRLDRGWGRVNRNNPTTTVLLPVVGPRYETLIRWSGPEAVTFDRIVMHHAPGK